MTRPLVCLLALVALIAAPVEAQRFRDRDRGRGALANLEQVWRQMQAMEDAIDRGDVNGAVGAAEQVQAAWNELGPLAQKAIERVHPGTADKIANLPAEAAELAALRAAQLAAASLGHVVAEGHVEPGVEIIIPPVDVEVAVLIDGQVVEGCVKYLLESGQTYVYYGEAWIAVEGTYQSSGYTYYASAASAAAVDGCVYVPQNVSGQVYWTSYGAEGPAGGSVEGQSASVFLVGANGAVAAGATEGTYTRPNGETGSYKAAGAAGVYQDPKTGTVYSGAAGAVEGENGRAAGATVGKTYENAEGGLTHESKQAFGAESSDGRYAYGTREGSTSGDGQGNATHRAEWDAQTHQGEVEVDHQSSVEGAGTGQGSYSGQTDVTKDGQTKSYATDATRGQGATHSQRDAEGSSQWQSPRARAQSDASSSRSGSSSSSASSAQRQAEQAQARARADQSRKSAQSGSQSPFAGSGQGLGSRQTSPQTQSHFSSGGSSRSGSSGGASRSGSGGSSRSGGGGGSSRSGGGGGSSRSGGGGRGR